MGLFGLLRRRRYQQRYRSAWTLLLAEYSLQQIDATSREAVLSRVANFRRANGWLSEAHFSQPYGRHLMAECVVALRTLGIAPALQGEIWPVPLGVRMNEGDGSAFEFRPPGTLRAVMFIGRLWRDYRPLDVAIRDARRDLRERGVRLLSDDSARE